MNPVIHMISERHAAKVLHQQLGGGVNGWRSYLAADRAKVDRGERPDIPYHETDTGVWYEEHWLYEYARPLSESVATVPVLPGADLPLDEFCCEALADVDFANGNHPMVFLAMSYGPNYRGRRFLTPVQARALAESILKVVERFEQMTEFDILAMYEPLPTRDGGAHGKDA